MNNVKFRAATVFILLLVFISSALPYNTMTKRRLDSVHPILKEKFYKISDEMERKYPKYDGLEVVSGYRTYQHQDQLFRQRKTPARGGYSYHNFALAIDVAPFKNGKPVWNDVKFWQDHTKVVKKYGLESGGSWRKKDYPHIQIPSVKYSISRARSDFQRGGFKEVFIPVSKIMGEKNMPVNTARRPADKSRKQFACSCHKDAGLKK